MQRFYFNVRRASAVYEDHEGQVLEGRPQAWDWAIRDAQALIDQGAVDGHPEDFWIEILDAKRRPVATVPFAGLN